MKGRQQIVFIIVCISFQNEHWCNVICIGQSKTLKHKFLVHYFVTWDVKSIISIIIHYAGSPDKPSNSWICYSIWPSWTLFQRFTGTETCPNTELFSVWTLVLFIFNIGAIWALNNNSNYWIWNIKDQSQNIFKKNMEKLKKISNTFIWNANIHLKRDPQYQCDTTKTPDTRSWAVGGLLIQATVSSQTLHSVLLEGISGSEDTAVFTVQTKRIVDLVWFFLGNHGCEEN